MEAITKRLNGWADQALKEIPKRKYQQFSALLPVLFKEDPMVAAMLIRSDEDAKAVAIKLKGDDQNNSLFALAEGVADWEAATGKKFDKRFTLDEHETHDPAMVKT